MICPSCQEDFEPQVTHCPYCGAPSPVGVEAGAEAGGGEDLGPLVFLIELRDPAAASKACEALAAKGIPFLVQGQGSFRSLGVSGLLRGDDAMTEARQILVPEALVSEASEVLEERDAES